MVAALAALKFTWQTGALGVPHVKKVYAYVVDGSECRRSGRVALLMRSPSKR